MSIDLNTLAARKKKLTPELIIQWNAKGTNVSAIMQLDFDDSDAASQRADDEANSLHEKLEKEVMADQAEYYPFRFSARTRPYPYTAMCVELMILLKT
eukprot:SAG31_NODE_1677_length_7533_cov_2.288054_6_plen_98_part_00